MSQIVFLENSLPYRQPEMISVLHEAKETHPKKGKCSDLLLQKGVSDQNKGLTATADHALKANQRRLHLV